MKTARLFQVLMFAGTLVAAASASDDSLPPLPSTASEYSIAETSTAPAPAGNDGAGSQPSPALDRRDRIFYPGDTERPKPLLRKLFLNIAFDQKDIFTSPFHVNRHNALEWLVPMAATGALIASDTHIANAFENSRGQVR